MGTTFETKLRLFRDKNYKYIFGLVPFSTLASLETHSKSKDLLAQFSSVGVTSDITHFFLWKKNTVFSRVFATLVRLYTFFKVLFWLFFMLSYLSNLVQYTLTRVLRINYTKRTKTQVMKPRETLFEILKLAEEEGRSVVYIDFDTQAGNVVRELVTRLYPQLEFQTYIHTPRSLSLNQQSGSFFVDHPHWYEAKLYLEAEKRDLVLIASREGITDELQALLELRKDEKVHFAAVLLCDVSTLASVTNLSTRITNLHRLFVTHTLEQYIDEMDKRELWNHSIQLAIQYDDSYILDKGGEFPRFTTHTSKGLEVEVLEALTEIVYDTRQVSVAGKVKRDRLSRIMPRWDLLKARNYATVRSIDLRVPLVYTGPQDGIRKDYRVG